MQAKLADESSYFSVDAFTNLKNQLKGEFLLPLDIKKAVFALAVSCLCTLLAVDFAGLEHEEIGYGNPLILWTNLIWVGVVAWITWDLVKGKNIKLSLVFVGAIMVGALVWDVFEYGVGIPQFFYAVEIAMFGAAYFFVSSKESTDWRAKKAS